MHLILDGRGSRNLSNVEAIEDFVRQATQLTNMQLLFLHSEVLKGDGIDPGVTTIGIIITSSITVHTYPEEDQKYIYIDVFSCHDFDHVAVRNLILATFGLTPKREMLLNRGEEHQGGLG